MPWVLFVSRLEDDPRTRTNRALERGQAHSRAGVRRGTSSPSYPTRKSSRDRDHEEEEDEEDGQHLGFQGHKLFLAFRSPDARIHLSDLVSACRELLISTLLTVSINDLSFPVSPLSFSRPSLLDTFLLTGICPFSYSFSHTLLFLFLLTPSG